MNDNFHKTHVKILVHTEPMDGYPPEEWEGLWAIPIGSGLFKIDNIPFFAKNLSCDDIVEAQQDGDEYIFQRVVEPSENSTIRVVVFDLDDVEAIRRDLLALRCSIEGTGTPGLIAVSVPPASLADVLALLDCAFAGEKLDFEEGVVRPV